MSVCIVHPKSFEPGVRRTIKKAIGQDWESLGFWNRAVEDRCCADRRRNSSLLNKLAQQSPGTVFVLLRTQVDDQRTRGDVKIGGEVTSEKALRRRLWDLRGHLDVHPSRPDPASRPRGGPATDLTPDRLPGTQSAASSAVVSDTKAEEIAFFRGTVNRIEGATAYVSLKDRLGQEGSAELSAEHLAARGIHEDDHFTCRIMRRGADTVMSFAPVKRRRLSDAEVRQLWQEVESLADDLA